MSSIVLFKCRMIEEENQIFFFSCPMIGQCMSNCPIVGQCKSNCWIIWQHRVVLVLQVTVPVSLPPLVQHGVLLPVMGAQPSCSTCWDRTALPSCIWGGCCPTWSPTPTAAPSPPCRCGRGSSGPSSPCPSLWGGLSEKAIFSHPGRLNVDSEISVNT